MARFPNPPAMEEGSIGFLARRPDRPERFGLFHPSGELSNTFGHAEHAQDIADQNGLQICPVGKSYARGPYKGQARIYLVWRKGS